MVLRVSCSLLVGLIKLSVSVGHYRLAYSNSIVMAIEVAPSFQRWLDG